MKNFIVIFSILFYASCGPTKDECDLKVKSLYPGNDIEVISANDMRIYTIDQEYSVFCDMAIPGAANIEKAYSGPWKATYCGRLDPNNRWDAEDFKKYKCGPEKSR